MKRGAGSPLDRLSLSSRFGEQAMPEELGEPVVTISRPPAEKQAKRATVTPTAAHSAKPKVVSPPAEKQAARVAVSPPLTGNSTKTKPAVPASYPKAEFSNSRIPKAERRRKVSRNGLATTAKVADSAGGESAEAKGSWKKSSLGSALGSARETAGETGPEAAPAKAAQSGGLTGLVFGRKKRWSIDITESLEELRSHFKPNDLLDHLFDEDPQAALFAMHSTQKQRNAALREIIIYACFMFLFTMSQAKGLMNPTIFQFGNAIRTQLTDAEFLPTHSPNYAKTFHQISTVNDLHKWMVGPLCNFVFTTDSFDDKERWANGQQVGHAVGHAVFLGPVRISQVRANRMDCGHKVWSRFPDMQWDCYDGGSSSTFAGYDLYSFHGGEYENVSEFGQFNRWNYSTPKDHRSKDVVLRNTGPFVFNGIHGSSGQPLNNSDVKADRGRWFSEFQTNELSTFPAPAFHVTVDPLAGDEGSGIVKDLVNSGYIDIHTRAITVDMTLYNPMVDRICWFRCIAELSESGGVQPSYEFEVLRPWENNPLVGEVITADDKLFVFLQILVAMFYLYYCAQEAYYFKVKGWRDYFSTWMNVAQFVNIFLYIWYYFMTYR